MKARELTLCSLLLACSSTGRASMERDPAILTSGEGVVFVAAATEDRPRLRYLDGQLSRNDTCFIRIGNKLNKKVPPLYINGAPVGFC